MDEDLWGHPTNLGMRRYKVTGPTAQKADDDDDPKKITQELYGLRSFPASVN
jgi:hypothetical protein